MCFALNTRIQCNENFQNGVEILWKFLALKWMSSKILIDTTQTLDKTDFLSRGYIVNAMCIYCKLGKANRLNDYTKQLYNGYIRQ